MRCGRCGNENDQANRFCGMCGASLVATPQASVQPPTPTENVAAPRPIAVPVPPPVQAAPRHAVEAPLAGPSALSSATTERRPAPLRSEVQPSAGPVITGHSFLGLSTPGPAVDRHAGYDPLRPSSSLDYLLDDEEEPKRGWGKLILIVVALGLALGFGYLRWKDGGFDWLNAGDKKSTAAKAAQSADSGGASGTTTPGGAAPAAGASDTGTAPAAGGAAASPAEPAAGQVIPPQSTSQAPVQATPSQTAPPIASPSPANPPQTQPTDPNLPTASASPAVSSDADKQTPQAAPPPQRKPATRKPSPSKVAAAKPIDPVAEAERYIYGRGVGQDCDHGLRLMKPAAEQSNTKAMISLGALYSTGTCTPRDLPTAYRWFALALHKDPDNQALQDDLQKLWSQMTPPERQLAIKLSQ